MTDQIKINVNGSEISSKPDQLIIEACEDSGIHIPVSYTHLTLPTNREV